MVAKNPGLVSRTHICDSQPVLCDASFSDPSALLWSLWASGIELKRKKKRNGYKKAAESWFVWLTLLGSFWDDSLSHFW